METKKRLLLLRRVIYYDDDKRRVFQLLTNIFDMTAEEDGQLYRQAALADRTAF